MSLVRGFLPIADERSRALVLGTLPGGRSLRLREYYADGGNSFWEIMGSLVDASRSLPYAGRVARLLSHGIAVWDVLERAERPGSLDKGIVPGSEVANDFDQFFAAHRKVAQIYFNGGKPAKYYRELVMPTLDGPWARLPRQTLASTSGANTHLRRDAKVHEWSVITRADV